MNNNNNDRSGAWDIPLREYVKTLPVVISIYNLKHNSFEKEFHIDYGNKDDRLFLGKISFWAYQNGRSVECMSKEEWAKQKE